MAKFFQIFRRQYQKIIECLIKRLPIYYKSIDKLPVYNWFMIQNNDLKWLYKYRIFKYIPGFFLKVITDMVYQFETLDLTMIRKRAEYEILRSMAARQNNKNLEFNANLIEKEIEKLEKKIKDDNGLTLNGFLDYIEMTFESIGSLDPYKLSTSRAFSLYHKAIEKNKQLKAQYEKMNHVNY